jgi:hypothetical protein
LKIPTYKEQPKFLRYLGGLGGVATGIIFGCLLLLAREDFPIIENLYEKENVLYGLLVYFGSIFVCLTLGLGVPFIGGVLVEIYKEVFKKAGKRKN